MAEMADEEILRGIQAKCLLTSWSFSSLKRVARSSAAAEDSLQDLEYTRRAYSERSGAPTDMRSPLGPDPTNEGSTGHRRPRRVGQLREKRKQRAGYARSG